jgi:hypothetical protein
MHRNFRKESVHILMFSAMSAMSTMSATMARHRKGVTQNGNSGQKNGFLDCNAICGPEYGRSKKRSIGEQDGNDVGIHGRDAIVVRAA